MHFTYTAVSSRGTKLSGEIEALNRAGVLETLHKLGHLPIDVVENDRNAGRRGARRGFLFSGNPSAGQITLFTRELAMLLKAGLSLDRALEFLEKDTRSAKMARLISLIGEQIRSGKSLYEALDAQDRAFPPIYTNMIRVAEASGTLVAVLERAAKAREKAQKIRDKAISQFLYPSILVIMAIAVVTIMLTFVVPRFKDMIEHAGANVPAQARLVIAASDWLTANGEFLAISVLGVFLALAVAWRQPLVRRELESSLLRVPLLGNIMRLNLTARFCGTLEILLENGVDLPSAVKLVRDVIGNSVATRALDQSYDALRKGKSFLEPLEQARLFPPVLINALRVGEETGSLSNSLRHMTEMFEEKLQTTVERTFTILEPVILLLISVFIAGIIMSILSGVISMNDLAI